MVGEHWFRRAVPVTALAVGLVAVLALLFPGVREQLALSATHRTQPYVALAFARDDTGNVVTCGGDGDQVRVAFDVVSRLDAPRDVAWVATVHGDRRTGTATVDPGRTVEVSQLVPRPKARHYTVSVELPGEDREVHARCPRSTP